MSIKNLLTTGLKPQQDLIVNSVTTDVIISNNVNFSGDCVVTGDLNVDNNTYIEGNLEVRTTLKTDDFKPIVNQGVIAGDGLLINNPYMDLECTSAQTLTDGLDNLVQWNGGYSNGNWTSWFETSLPISQITVQRSGTYLINCNLAIKKTVAGETDFDIQVQRNDLQLIGQSKSYTFVINETMYVNLFYIGVLEVDDTVTVQIRPNTSNTLLDNSSSSNGYLNNIKFYMLNNLPTSQSWE